MKRNYELNFERIRYELEMRLPEIKNTLKELEEAKEVSRKTLELEIVI